MRQPHIIFSVFKFPRKLLQLVISLTVKNPDFFQVPYQMKRALICLTLLIALCSTQRCIRNGAQEYKGGACVRIYSVYTSVPPVKH